MVGPVSMTRRSATTAKRSPTRTAVRSVFHQHRMGSSATCPARGAGRGLGGSGAAGAAAGAGRGLLAAGRPAAGAGVPPSGQAPARCRQRQGQCPAPTAGQQHHGCVHGLSSSFRLPEPALGRELDERRFHLPPIQPHAHHVEAGVARVPLHPSCHSPTRRPAAPSRAARTRRVRPVSTSRPRSTRPTRAAARRRTARRPSAGTRRARRSPATSSSHDALGVGEQEVRDHRHDATTRRSWPSMAVTTSRGAARRVGRRDGAGRGPRSR